MGKELDVNFPEVKMTNVPPELKRDIISYANEDIRNVSDFLKMIVKKYIKSRKEEEEKHKLG